MEEIIKNALQHTFGNDSKILSYDIIANGYKNSCLKIQCNKYDKPIFMKIEKNFVIPRTQKYQIKREISGIRLCKEKGINVPTIINSDDNGLFCGRPWLFEEFIDGKLIAHCAIEEENRRLLGLEFENVLTKILSIESNYYGDTFENGLIGRHDNWNKTISKITSLLLEDCESSNIFNESSNIIIKKSLEKALSFVKCNSKPVFYDYDLFSANVFAKKNNNKFHLGSIIDFGMSMFAPIHFVQHQTRKFTDFQIQDMDVCDMYGSDKNELIAYDILRLEPILLLNRMKYNYGKINYASETDLYVNKCTNYLHEE